MGEGRKSERPGAGSRFCGSCGTARKVGLWCVAAVAAAATGVYLSGSRSLRGRAPLEDGPPESAAAEQRAQPGGALSGQTGIEDQRPAPGSAQRPSESVPQTPASLYAEAYQVLKRLNERFPNSPDATEMMARLQSISGNTAEAVRLWKEILRSNPDYAYAHVGLGSVAAKKGEHEEAAEAFRRALAIHPQLTATYLDLADSLVKLGRVEEAAAVLRKYLEMEPRSAAGMILLGQAYLQSKEYEKAKTQFEAAILVTPDSPPAQYGLGTAYARLGQSEKSKQAMARCLELRSKLRSVTEDQRSLNDDLGLARENVEKLYSGAGRVYAAAGDLRQAEELWLKAAAVNPKGVDCRRQLVVLYRRSERFQDALEICRQLIEIDPGNADYQRVREVIQGRSRP